MRRVDAVLNNMFISKVRACNYVADPETFADVNSFSPDTSIHSLGAGI